MKDAKKKIKIPTKLMPVDKDGNEVDYFRGWPGVKDLANAYGKTWLDVALLMEEMWGDKTGINQIVACSYIAQTLDKIANKDKEVLTKRHTKETDIHLAIRLNLKDIKRYYEPKAKDEYKAIRQMYEGVMKKRAKFVYASNPYWLYKDKIKMKK